MNQTEISHSAVSSYKLESGLSLLPHRIPFGFFLVEVLANNRLTTVEKIHSQTKINYAT